MILLSPFFSPVAYIFSFFLSFSSKSNNSEASLTIWNCLTPSKSTGSVDFVTLYRFFISMAKKDISMTEKDVSMTAKGQTFNSFVTGTPMITSWINTREAKIIYHGLILWTYGLLVMVVRIILPLRTHVSPKINVLSGEKLMLYYAIFSGNLLMPRLYIILGPTNLATLSKIR